MIRFGLIRRVQTGGERWRTVARRWVWSGCVWLGGIVRSKGCARRRFDFFTGVRVGGRSTSTVARWSEAVGRPARARARNGVGRWADSGRLARPEGGGHLYPAGNARAHVRSTAAARVYLSRKDYTCFLYSVIVLTRVCASVFGVCTCVRVCVRERVRVCAYLFTLRPVSSAPPPRHRLHYGRRPFFSCASLSAFDIILEPPR